ncbi:MAG: ABC transporter permease [Acidobacteriaceae bacterium]|nr:ABC transporter permease [Acidobacteriaceae bacterium]MBV9499333.1 ABC transporter permease [Acidobacteriaceae bacterium]
MNIKLRPIWRRIDHFRSDSDLEEELRVHLELTAEDNLASGMTDVEARRGARLQLGRTRSIIESVRDQEFITALESWYRDLLVGLRILRRAPIFCLTSILTLALGIGVNTAVFSVLYGLLLRSLPVTRPDRLAHIGLVSSSFRPQEQGSFVPYRMLPLLSQEQRSFSGVSAWGTGAVTMRDAEGTLRRYDAGLVSGNGFSVLGMKPYLGRLIALSDDVRAGPLGAWPVVLSYGFWKGRFGGNPQVIGKRIKVKDVSLTVIGITPPAFEGVWPGIDPKIYVPLQFLNVLAGRDVLNQPSSLAGFAAIGRLRPGVSIRDANAEVAVYRKQLLDTIPLEYRRLPVFENASFRVNSARTGLPTFFGYAYSRPLFLLQGLVGIVLLLCCVNVGGLMMSKVYVRRREFAVRTAIGAARGRLISQYLTESLVIALAGALLGSVGAWRGAGLLLHFFRDPNMFEGMSLYRDATFFLITGLLGVTTTLFFGTLPAWSAGRFDTGVLLGSRTAFGGSRQIAGRAFVPIQVALSLALLALATLLSESLAKLRGEYTGFDTNHVTIQTPPFDELMKGADGQLDLYQRMVDRIEQLPGIRSAAVTWYTPLTGEQSAARFQAIASRSGSPEGSQLAYNDVGPGYFRTMQTPILFGREFEKNERQSTVCILNQSAAKFLFPYEPAIGHYVRSNDTRAFPRAVSCRVIGIAQDAKFASLRDAPPRTIYFPVRKQTIGDAGDLVFLINSESKAEAIAAYRTALQEIAPSMPLVLFVTLREQMDAGLGSHRLITAMSRLFAGLALLLSALGLYGLLSASVVQRAGEIGVRMALGAERVTVLRMILTEALRLVGAGVVLGAAVLLFVMRFVKNMLYGVSPFDPLILFVTIVLLIAVAMFAGMGPALRAASVDPIDALRAE